MALYSTRLIVHRKDSTDSMEFEFMPAVTTLRDVLDSARLLFDTKSLWLTSPSMFQAQVHSPHAESIGDVFGHGDTAALVPLTPPFQEEFHLYKVTFPEKKPSVRDLLSHKLNAYHTVAGVALTEKPVVECVDVQVKGKCIRFCLASKQQDSTERDAPKRVFLLASDSLQDLHEGIRVAFGVSSSMAKRRLSLFSPNDNDHWFEDPLGWERSNGVRLHELGLSGPKLEGTFDELSLVMVKTTIAGKTIALRTRLSDTVEMVKAKLQDIIGIPPDRQELTFHKTILEDRRSLAQHGVSKRNVLKLVLHLPNTTEPVASERKATTNNPLSLTLVLPGNRREKIQVSPSGPLSDLRQFGSLIDKEELGLVHTASIEAVSTSSSIENKCQFARKNKEREDHSNKKTVDRTKRTIDNAIQSLRSFDRKNEHLKDDISNFGEI